MPMFYIPKPRRFHYEPRFYDPEKERREVMKMQQALRRGDDMPTADAADAANNAEAAAGNDKDLEYFEQRVRTFDELSTHKPGKLTWRDMVRKREMPQFNYTPRFADGDAGESQPKADAQERLDEARERSIHIKRRFDASRILQRKQQGVWIKVALVLLVFYIVYRTYVPITQFLYNIIF